LNKRLLSQATQYRLQPYMYSLTAKVKVSKTLLKP